SDAERTDGSGDICSTGLFFLEVLDGLAGHPDAGCIDVCNFRGQAMACDSKAVGAEGVGFQDLSAGLKVFLVDGKNEVGVGKVQLVIATIDENAASVEDRTHSAIGEHRAV